MNLPLDGLCAWVTRPAPASVRSAERLRAFGARALLAPTVRIEWVEPSAEELAALDRAEPSTWVVLASANAAEGLARAVGDEHRLGRFRCASVGGRTTAAALGVGLQVEFESPRATGEDLARALWETWRPRRVFVPGSESRRPELGRYLAGRGVEVHEIVVHRTVGVTSLEGDMVRALAEGVVHLGLAYSPSALAFVDALEPADADPVRALPWAALGGTSADAARARGLRVVAAPTDPGEEALLLAVARWWARRGEAGH